jgi:hypothetical protein
MNKRRYSKTLIFTLVAVFILLTNLAYAKSVTFQREYTYQASEADSKLTCRAIALAQVKRLLLEVKNYQLTKDEITTLTADYRVGNLVDATSQKGEKDMRLLLVLALAFLLSGCAEVKKSDHKTLKKWRDRYQSATYENGPEISTALVTPDETGVYGTLKFLVCVESGDLHEIELTLYEEHTEILYDEIPVIVPDQDATSQALCWDSDIDDSFDKYSSPGVAGDYFFTVIVRDPEGHESNEVYTYLTVKE